MLFVPKYFAAKIVLGIKNNNGKSETSQLSEHLLFSA